MKDFEERERSSAGRTPSKGILDYLRRKSRTPRKVIAKLKQTLQQISGLMDFYRNAYEELDVKIKGKDPIAAYKKLGGPGVLEEHEEFKKAQAGVSAGGEQLQMLTRALKDRAISIVASDGRMEHREVKDTENELERIHTSVTDRSKVTLIPVGSKKSSSKFKRDFKKFGLGVLYLGFFAANFNIKSLKGIDEFMHEANQPKVASVMNPPSDYHDNLAWGDKATGALKDFFKDAFEGKNPKPAYVCEVPLRKTMEGNQIRMTFGLGQKEQSVNIDGKRYDYVR